MVAFKIQQMGLIFSECGNNTPNDEKMCSEGVKAQISSSPPCDKQNKICDCCKDIVTEINEISLELHSCKEIIKLLHDEIRDIKSQAPIITVCHSKPTTHKTCDLHKAVDIF